MITIHTTADDLVKMRFAYRPLLEIPLSYRVLVNPEFQSPYHRWVDETFHTLHDLELPYLSALVTPYGYIPDFMTPTPSGKQTDIEADFAELLATPDEAIRAGILELISEHGDSDMRRYFLAHPREGVACLVEEMRVYWQYALAHHWSRMIANVEGDMLYRARLLALDGPGAMFSDLHSTVSLDKNQLVLQHGCQHRHADVKLSLNGEGLQLVPLIFKGCGRMYQVAPGWQPMLAYGIRGMGLWYQRQPTDDQSLELALGAGRARVLRALSTPATTGEVAYRLRISAAAASQHLARLTKAGLSQPRRSGKRVYYHLTERGQKLLTLFAD
jgi:DNA-binding transcriptional ArsR family regulator